MNSTSRDLCKLGIIPINFISQYWKFQLSLNQNQIFVFH